MQNRKRKLTQTELLKQLKGIDSAPVNSYAHKWQMAQREKPIPIQMELPFKWGNPDRAVVYFVSDYEKQYIKIGYSTNFKNRLSSLQTSSALPLITLGITTSLSIYEAHKLERELHRRFRYLRFHGEWFRTSETLLEEIKKLSL